MIIEPEQPASYYENINQLLKVFIQHPFIFNSSDSLELLCNLLKQRVLELGLSQSISHLSKNLISHLSSNTFTYNRSMCIPDYLFEKKRNVFVCIFARKIHRIISLSHSSLLDSELSSYLTLHPPIAKRALYCMCALHANRKDEFLEKLIHVR